MERFPCSREGGAPTPGIKKHTSARDEVQGLGPGGREAGAWEPSAWDLADPKRVGGWGCSLGPSVMREGRPRLGEGARLRRRRPGPGAGGPEETGGPRGWVTVTLSHAVTSSSGRPGRGSGGEGRDPSGRGSIPAPRTVGRSFHSFNAPCCHYQRGPTRGGGAALGGGGWHSHCSQQVGLGPGGPGAAAPADQSQAFWEGAAGRPGR